MLCRKVLLAVLGSVMLTSSACAEPELTVLPIDKAKFWVGQRFDMEVELRGAKASDIKVFLDGKEIKHAAFKPEENLSSFRMDQMSFSKEGEVQVDAIATVDGKPFKKTLTYTVVGDDKASAPAKRARNVILFIGDGMGLVNRQIGRILSKGIHEGKYNGLLEMEQLNDGTALLTTSGYDSLVTDSANSASAYATGHKSVVNAMGVYENATPDPLDDPKVENIAELLKRARGMSVGVVTTSNITDATPAAMVAHTRRRAEQNFIAETLLKADVVLGGGSRQFLPKDIPGSKRKDDRNLVEEFKAKGYAFAGDREGLAAAKDGKLLGLFALDNLNVYLDREILRDPEVLGDFTKQPTLMEMTQKAIDILSKNENGFFLMVEGACIDKQLHTMDWERAAYDTIEMDQAVGLARRFAARNGDTLVIATADHSHGASISGTYHERDGKTGREAVRTYADSTFPTYVDSNKDGFPDSPVTDVTLAVHFANHPDHYEDFKFKKSPVAPAIMSGDVAIANKNRAPAGLFYLGNIPSGEPSEVHAADDVPLSAGGPGADYFRGVMDNTEVFFGMIRALGLGGEALQK